MNRQLLTVLGAVVASCIVAACGSSSSSSSSSTSSRSSASAASAGRTKFAACLKAHGVTVPAGLGAGRRPNRGAPGGGPGSFFGGGGGGAGGGRLAANPKFRAALKACAGSFPRRGFGAAPRRTAIVKFVTCVRKHGYQLPQPNFSGRGSVFPAKIARSPKFKAASRACASALRPPGGGAGGGAPPSA